MTNLLVVLPDFDLAPYTHILPSLEKALIATADLLALDAFDIAKRAQVPPGEVKKLADAVLRALHDDTASACPTRRDEKTSGDAWGGLGTGKDLIDRWSTISTLDDGLNAALGGGIARGHLTEIVGESAAGKTQFLLTLLLAGQLQGGAPRSHGTSVLYISTEAPLQTTRLSQILKTHPKLADLPLNDRPSLSKVHSTHIHDLEAQEHILRYQVPVAIKKHNIGLLVIDSIAANYRAEFDKGGHGKRTSDPLAQRSAQLAQTGSHLRSLARVHNIAVVVANQVADRFTPEPFLHPHTQSTQNSRPSTPSRRTNLHPELPTQASATGLLSTDDPLVLDQQQRFFTGWGDDDSATNMKTPSLGLTWTNQLSARVALLKKPIYENKMYAPGDERNLIGWDRSCKAVFSPWCAESNAAFEIWEGGIRSISGSEAEV
ncbi:Putative DNA recombination and repair protein Rad51 [Septoria linicola]|uniref:DNA recombination and repair protein Rad51 n=1 Tax=Septoria linicola TaxID=215465 RepID=A0A9Q9AVZ4_9PEZI|nr:Putative DNA recombination and repair protein Rad51 [Septoria linicola]